MVMLNYHRRRSRPLRRCGHHVIMVISIIASGRIMIPVVIAYTRRKLSEPIRFPLLLRGTRDTRGMNRKVESSAGHFRCTSDVMRGKRHKIRRQALSASPANCGISLSIKPSRVNQSLPQSRMSGRNDEAAVGQRGQATTFKT